MTALPADMPATSTRPAPRDLGASAPGSGHAGDAPAPGGPIGGIRIVVVDADESSSGSLEQLLQGTGAERVMAFQEPLVGLGYLASIGAEPPRFGESRADLEVGVEAGQRLEELGRDGCAPSISLGGRIESGRASGEDPDGAIRTGGRLPST